MEFKIKKEIFLKALSKIQNIINPGNIIPILNNIIIKTENKNEINLLAHNLDFCMNYKLKSEITNEGIISINPKKIINIVKSFSNSDISVILEKDFKLKLISDNIFFNIFGYDSIDFPDLLSVKNENIINIDSEIFHRMIKNVFHAQASINDNNIFNSIFFKFKNNKLTTVATDGRRMSLMSTNLSLNMNKDFDKSFILSKKANNILEKILSDNVGNNNTNINLSFDNENVSFKIIKENESFSFISKILNNNFPNYENIFPNKEDQNFLSLEVNRKIFLKALTRTLIVSDVDEYSVTLNIYNNYIEISSYSSKIGFSSEKIDNIIYNGPEITLKFNPKYLIDPLKILKDENIFFKFKNSNISPCIIENKTEFKCIIMPLRV